MDRGMATGSREVSDMGLGYKHIKNRTQPTHTVGPHGRPVMNIFFEQAGPQSLTHQNNKSNLVQVDHPLGITLSGKNKGNKQLLKNVSLEEDVNMQEEDQSVVDRSNAKGRSNDKVWVAPDSPKEEHSEYDGVSLVEKGLKKVNLKRHISVDVEVKTEPLSETLTLKPEVKVQTHQMVNQINIRKNAEPQHISYDKDYSGQGLPWNNPNFEITGGGSFGKTANFNYKDTNYKDGRDIVIKKITGRVFINEIEIPLKFRSPFIERVLALGYDGESGYLVMENAGKNLQAMCQMDILRQEEHMARLLMDLLEALCLLSRFEITHCDIKPENVCLKWSTELNRLVACLIDFGSSRTIQDHPSYHGVTPEYLPPAFNARYHKAWLELKQSLTIKPERLTPKDDVWAVAMVMIFLQWGEHPMVKHFTGNGYPKDATSEDRFAVYQQIGQMSGRLPDKFFALPEKVQPVIENMLEIDHRNRFSAHQAKTMLKDLVYGDVNPQVQKKQKVEISQPVFKSEPQPAFKSDKNTPMNINIVTQRGPQQPIKPNVIYLKGSDNEHGSHMVMTNQTKMMHKVMSPVQFQQTRTKDQSSGYGDVDMTTKKIVLNPASPNVNRPVFQLSRPNKENGKLFCVIENRPKFVRQARVVEIPHNQQGHVTFTNYQNSHQGLSMVPGQTYIQYQQGQRVFQQGIQQHVMSNFKPCPGVTIRQTSPGLNIPDFSKMGFSMKDDGPE